MYVYFMCMHKNGHMKQGGKLPAFQNPQIITNYYAKGGQNWQEKKIDRRGTDI